MVTGIISFMQKRKYELLLFALMQHLFIGIFLKDLLFYEKVIWPINMIILGVASIGVFSNKGSKHRWLQLFLFLLVLALPIGLIFFYNNMFYGLALNIIYVIYFTMIFIEVLRFLIKPSYINADIISASACGYMLLIEISTFLFQFFVYQNHDAFKGIDYSSHASNYIDMVYFSTITLTSIGYGDITPNIHFTKLLTSLFGIAGQFYSVVLVGILISKFTSSTSQNN